MDVPAQDVRSKRIVVSGINGYIASALGLEILQAGHVLVGTSRSPQHETALRSGAFAPYSSRFVYYCVPDMTIDGAFDQALQGAHAFLHLASPIASSQSFETSIEPAIKSVNTALASAVAAGVQFKKFVYLSSIAAVLDHEKIQKTPDHDFTEDDWNERAARVTSHRNPGDEELPWMVWYSASKVRAERALFEFTKTQHINFSVSSIQPAYVYGPPVLNAPLQSVQQLPTSLEPIYALSTAGGGEHQPSQMDYLEPYVDVRDVITMCMWLIQNHDQGHNQRFLAVAGHATPAEIWAVVKQRASRNSEGNGIHGPNANSARWKPGQWSANNARAESLMGVQFRGLDESVGDTCAAMWAAGAIRAW